MLVYGCVSLSPWLLGWFLPPEWPALVGCASLFHATACGLCCCNLFDMLFVSGTRFDVAQSRQVCNLMTFLLFFFCFKFHFSFSFLYYMCCLCPPCLFFCCGTDASAWMRSARASNSNHDAGPKAKPIAAFSPSFIAQAHALVGVSAWYVITHVAAFVHAVVLRRGIHIRIDTRRVLKPRLSLAIRWSATFRTHANACSFVLCQAVQGATRRFAAPPLPHSLPPLFSFPNLNLLSVCALTSYGFATLICAGPFALRPVDCGPRLLLPVCGGHGMLVGLHLVGHRPASLCPHCAPSAGSLPGIGQPYFCNADAGIGRVVSGTQVSRYLCVVVYFQCVVCPQFCFVY